MKTRKITEVPAVMGTSISKTIILAVNCFARGTTSDSEQSTLPMLRFTGSTDVKVRTTFEPEAAHGTDASSISMADCKH